MLQRMGIINAEALFSFPGSRTGSLLLIVVSTLLYRQCDLAVSAVIYLYSLLSENLSKYVTITSINADCAHH